MRAVNLLPADRGAANKRSAGVDGNRKTLLIGSGIVGTLIIAGLSFMVYSTGSTVGQKSKQLDALQSQIASTPTDSTLQAAMGSRKTTVVSLVANRLAWDQLLDTISKVMPEDVWLQNLTSTTPGAAAMIASEQAAALAAAAPPTTTTTTTTTTPAPAAASVLPSTFTISGYTYSQPSVARMMRRLTIVPWLTGVSLVTSSKTSVGPDTVFQFTVKASLVSPQAIP